MKSGFTRLSNKDLQKLLLNFEKQVMIESMIPFLMSKDFLRVINWGLRELMKNIHKRYFPILNNYNLIVEGF
jgi:hypothetical protein